MWWIAPVVLAVVAGACALWAQRRLLVVRVIGQSMLPALQDGQKLLARRTSRVPATGTIVVVAPFGDSQLVVKRLAAVAGEPVPPEVAQLAGIAPGSTVPPGNLVLLGDNADASIDSRVWGLMSVSSVVAVVVRKMRNDVRPESEKMLTGEPVPLPQPGETVEFGSFRFRLREDTDSH
ncbi:S26 family signal peptidase [Lentzea sp. NPDC051213]|uniref:S26 family signal peptidase n=1 Tax=Lentzea sp. NPDC051213 TaxID=3364126 RepID=UPI00378E3785